MRTIVLAAALLAVFATPASAQTAKITQRLLDDDGNPLLVASSYPDGSLGTVSWAICTPGCAPAASEHGVLAPGEQAAGTTFEATVGATTGS